MSKIKWVCCHCGSDRISSDADVEWDVDEQAWVVTGLTGDSYYCGNCDDERDAEEQVLPVPKTYPLIALMNRPDGTLLGLGLFGDSPFTEPELREALDDGDQVFLYRVTAQVSPQMVLELARNSKGHPSFILAALVAAQEIEHVVVGGYIG